MSLSLAYRGFNYVSYYNGGYVDADSLHDLAASGANAAGLNLEYGINVNTSTIYVDANYTDSLTTLGNTISEAVGLGLTVMVKPLIDFLDPAKIGPNSVDDWRAYFNPSNPAAFFASYKSMIVAEAQVAQAHGATLLSLGTELDQLTGPQYLSYWTDIISSVRAVFSGQLTYSALWNDDTSPWAGHNGLMAGTGNIATQVSFWSQLDYVGLDVYPPISDLANPTLANLTAGWTQVPTDPYTRAATGNQSLISYFEGIAEQIGKPLLFTEIGYESATDAAFEPAGSSTNVYDPTLQANLYKAFFDAWTASGNSSLNGLFIWNWDPNTSEVGPTNGANFSPQGLPAASVIKTGFDNAAPAVAANDAFTLAENATLTGHNVFANNGSGADSGTGIAVTAVDGLAAAVGAQITLASGAHLTLNADGTFAYDPNHAFDSLGAGATRSDNFTYTITGGSTAVATITVNGVDDAPVITSNGGGATANVSVAENGTAVTTVHATDIDSLTLTYGIAGGADAGAFQINSLTGDLSFKNAPDYEHPTDSGHDNSYIVQVTASDGSQSSDPQTITVKVTNVGGTNDFSGDDHGDVLFRNDNGGVSTWDMHDHTFTGFDFTASSGLVPTSWHIAGKGDFNGDGVGDIVWRNDNGDVSTWDMHDHTFVGFNFGGVPTSWHIVGTGDFNGDGKTDLLFRNDSGAVSTWNMNDHTFTGFDFTASFGVVPMSWKVAGTGDFNGDGITDILWRNDNGEVATWDMNDHTFTGFNFGVIPTDWHIVGTGDFNGDGKTDILWHNDNGAVSTWDMNDHTFIGFDFTASAGLVPTSWQVADTGDYNGDGKTDIVWRNTNGAVSTWDMNDHTFTGFDFTASAGAVPTSWHIS